MGSESQAGEQIVDFGLIGNNFRIAFRINGWAVQGRYVGFRPGRGPNNGFWWRRLHQQLDELVFNGGGEVDHFCDDLSGQVIVKSCAIMMSVRWVSIFGWPPRHPGNEVHDFPLATAATGS